MHLPHPTSPWVFPPGADAAQTSHASRAAPWQGSGGSSKPRPAANPRETENLSPQGSGANDQRGKNKHKSSRSSLTWSIKWHKNITNAKPCMLAVALELTRKKQSRELARGQQYSSQIYRSRCPSLKHESQLQRLQIHQVYRHVNAIKIPLHTF